MNNNLSAVMAQLEAAGTAQNRKVYARHGAAEPMFGVSYANLGKIAKPIKTDHSLAVELWDSGNHDARVLALRVADAAALDEPLAGRWLRDVDNYILAEGLGGLCAQSPHARELSDAWRDRSGEWEASTGWFIVTCTAEDPGVWSIDELRGLLGPDRGRDRRAAQPCPPRDERRAHRHRAARRRPAPRGARRRRSHWPGEDRPRPDRLQDPRSCPPTWSEPWPTGPPRPRAMPRRPPGAAPARWPVSAARRLSP